MKVAFVFPGQGSQSIGMGQALAEAFTSARETFEEVDDAIKQNLFRQMSDGPEELLTLTENTQPALMSVSMAIIKVLEVEGKIDLREKLSLTGTHVGCDTSQCGACVVHVDGKSIKSCTAFAADLDGSKITTIEGLVQNGKMHPMQEAFKKLHGLQCGFCTPGMVMSAIDLLQNNKKPSDTEIREWLEGNICRCTGYQNIIAAVKEAASKM